VVEGGKLRYSPGLDGLRALACGAVFLFHAHVLHLVGGFLGVSVFFTLSGFLITSLLLDELRSGQGFSPRSFWRRRIFRIVPLYAMVTLTGTIWALGAGGPLGRDTLIGAAGSACFLINWILAWHGAAGGILNGNWSVAVEEQFYVTWPLALAGLRSRLRSERAIAFILATVAILIAGHRWMIASQGFTRSWYATDTQADALLIGCVVALGWRARSRLLHVGAALAIIVALFTARTDIQTARIIMPLTAVSTAILVPFIQEHPGPLAWGPLVAIGRRSFGIYLWGCPIVYLLRFQGGLHGLELVSLASVFTALVAEPTYRLVELPMRRLGRQSSRPESRHPLLPPGAVAPVEDAA